MRYTKEDIQLAQEQLLKVLKPGDTVLCVLRNVSRSGMSREIDLQTTNFNWLSSMVAKVLGHSLGKKGGIKIGGCGMDMGFALVYSLSRTLFPTYRCLGKNKCDSSDHNNPGDCRKKIHTDGYALKHRWV